MVWSACRHDLVRDGIETFGRYPAHRGAVAVQKPAMNVLGEAFRAPCREFVKCSVVHANVQHAVQEARHLGLGARSCAEEQRPTRHVDRRLHGFCELVHGSDHFLPHSAGKLPGSQVASSRNSRDGEPGRDGESGGCEGGEILGLATYLCVRIDWVTKAVHVPHEGPERDRRGSLMIGPIRSSGCSFESAARFGPWCLPLGSL